MTPLYASKVRLDRLEEAYAIVDGVPDSLFDGDSWALFTGEAQNGPAAPECATNACFMGWCILHPTLMSDFIEERGMTEPYLKSEDLKLLNWKPKGRKRFSTDGFLLARRFFNISVDDSNRLFEPTKFWEKDSYGSSDKKIVLHRVKNFVEEVRAARNWNKGA